MIVWKVIIAVWIWNKEKWKSKTGSGNEKVQNSENHHDRVESHHGSLDLEQRKVKKQNWKGK